MSQLTVAEVGAMLEKHGLGEYAATFKAKGIDGKQLCAMTAKELTEAGVSNELHRKASCSGSSWSATSRPAI